MHILLILALYLCTQLFEAIVKSTKGRFQTTKTCSNHEINVLFEHGFYLKILKNVYVMSNDNARYSVSSNSDNQTFFCFLAGGLYGGASIIKSRLLPWLGTGFFSGGTADTSLSVIAEATSKNRELEDLQDMYETSLTDLERDLQAKEAENQDLRDE